MNFKKLISGILAGFMAISSIPFTAGMIATADETQDIWDGTSDTTWYDEEETELHISTPEQLAGMATLVNAGHSMEGQTIYLDNDIYLNDTSDYDNWETTAPANNWVPIGIDETNCFKGFFEGNEYSIEGLYSSSSDGSYQYSGFFGYLNACEMQNVNLNSTYIYLKSSNTTYVGGICGYSNTLISNCTINGTIFSFSSSSNSFCGGICGFSTTAITNCIVKGLINFSTSSTSYGGGIVGNTTEKISYCINKAKVNSIDNAIISTSSFYSYVGGIAGLSKNLIEYCHNNESVTSCSSGHSVVGGIVGNSNDTVNFCVNNGDINSTSENNYSYGGGIVGNSTGTTGTINFCMNNGMINSYAFKYSYSGGIVGNTNINVNFCLNNGDITSSTDSSPSYYACGGGITGYIKSNSSSISNCYNKGNIISYYAGGILGYSYCNISLSNLYNIGEITGTVSTGGIIGYQNTIYTPILSKVYYLNNTSKGVGNQGNDSAIAKSSANMKTESFAENLGDAFIYVANDYPRLAWETGDYSKFNKNAISFSEYGATETLELTTTYTGNPIWVSSNSTVATVDENGIVTAVGNGTATIYAICADSRAKCIVSVGYDYYLDNTDVTLKEGKTQQLKVYSSSTNEEATDVTVEYSSSNEAIATVDETGLIHAIKEGTAVITAKVADLELTCNVTVEAIPTTTVTTVDPPVIEGDNYTVAMNETKQLSVSNYTGSIDWVSGNTNCVTVSSDGVLTPVAIGDATVYALLSTGKTLSCTITVIEAKETTTAEETSTTTTMETELVTTEETTTTTELTTTQPVTTTTTTIPETTVTTTVTTTTIAPIKIDITEISITDGKDYKIDVDEDVTYTSSDESIATVDENGVVTPISNGETKIVVIDKNGNSKIIPVTVDLPITTTSTTVTEPETTTVSTTVITEIDTTTTTTITTTVQETTTITTTTETTTTTTIPETTVTTTVTTTEPLKAELSVTELQLGKKATIETNQNNLTFKTSNENVAAVSKSGVITPISAGTAVITILNEDGDSVQIKITVIDESLNTTTTTVITTTSTTTTSTSTTTTSTTTSTTELTTTEETTTSTTITTLLTTTTVTTTTIETEKSLLGDVNYDTKIDAKDAVQILKYYAATLAKQSASIDIEIADVNMDSKVDSKDAVKILRYYAATLAKTFIGSIEDFK